MKTEIILQEEVINWIHLIRRKRVLLDRDLASLYSVETRTLNQAVKRNIERFPDDFMFSLTRDEIRNLSHIVIGSKIKHSPNVNAFTEQGVAMLSSILNSKRAIQVNIEIMRVFTKMRGLLESHKDLVKKIDAMEGKYDKQFRVVFEAIKQLMIVKEKPTRKIGFR